MSHQIEGKSNRFRAQQNLEAITRMDEINTPVYPRILTAEEMATIDSPGATRAAEYNQFFNESDGIFTVVTGYGTHTHIGRWDLAHEVLANDHAFWKPDGGLFKPLVGEEYSLFPMKTYKGLDDLDGLFYNEIRGTVKHAFAENMAAAHFQQLVEIARQQIKTVKSTGEPLDVYTRNLSFHFTESLLGKGIQFPENFQASVTNILGEFYKARMVPKPDPEDIKTFETNLASLHTMLGEMINTYKGKFADGKVDLKSSKTELLGSLIWLTQNIPDKLKDTITEPPIPEHALPQAILSVIFGGIDTTAFSLSQMHAIFDRQPEVFETLMSDIRKSKTEKGYDLRTIKRLPSVKNFIGHLMNVGPSYALQRTVGPILKDTDPPEGTHVVRLGKYRLANSRGNMIIVHLARAIETDLGIDLNSKVDLNRTFKQLKAFGVGNRQCIGKDSAVNFIVSDLTAHADIDEKTVLDPTHEPIHDIRGSTRLIVGRTLYQRKNE